MVFKILDSNEVPQVGKRKQLHPRNCFLHLAALQQEGVITEAALLLAMVGLQPGVNKKHIFFYSAAELFWPISVLPRQLCRQHSTANSVPQGALGSRVLSSGLLWAGDGGELPGHA